jgi:hypothetical protein
MGSTGAPAVGGANSGSLRDGKAEKERRYPRRPGSGSGSWLHRAEDLAGGRFGVQSRGGEEQEEEREQEEGTEEAGP